MLNKRVISAENIAARGRQVRRTHPRNQIRRHPFDAVGTIACIGFISFAVLLAPRVPFWGFNPPVPNPEELQGDFIATVMAEAAVTGVAQASVTPLVTTIMYRDSTLEIATLLHSDDGATVARAQEIANQINLDRFHHGYRATKIIVYAADGGILYDSSKNQSRIHSFI